jgi:hypothetical protein
MLRIINDPDADWSRKDKLAVSAAPYCHPRVADARFGKKDQRAEAADTAGLDTPWEDDLEFGGRTRQ